MGCVRWVALGFGLAAAGCEAQEARAVEARKGMPLQAVAHTGAAVAEAGAASGAGPATERAGGARRRVGVGPTGSLQVELLEDGLARVVPLDGGPARTVPRTSLPPGVREGDVVVDGRRDARRTAELRREVAALRRRLASPAGGIDLRRADAR